MRKIAVASGKGGVGKSSIAASLAIALSRDHSIVCVDCDVDASNLALVLGVGKQTPLETISTSIKAEIIDEKCSKCRRCVESCMFGAVVWEHGPRIIRHYCEGCQTCSIACPEGAIRLEKVHNADLTHAGAAAGFSVYSAQLRPGESGSGRIVQYLKAKALASEPNKDIMLIDSAAGIGCPVIASISGTDHVVLVSEPTPAAFSDLLRTLSMAKHFNIPSSLVLNKKGLNPKMEKKILRFAARRSIRILGEIPYDRRFVDALVSMTPIYEYEPSFHQLFDGMAGRLLND